MTKQEVRAAALAKLAVRPADTLWDVGAGTGSVSVELALAAPQGHVYAVECEPDACALIRRNREKFAAWNLSLIEGRAPAALEALPAPDAVFIGGTKGSMAAVSGRLQIREWTDREGGKRTTAEVVADNVYFGESKRRDGGDTSRPAAPSASAPAHRGSYGGYDNVPQGGSAFSELDDDDGDLPF